MSCRLTYMEHRGTITALDRRANSASGNPSYSVTIDGSAFLTRKDATVNYKIHQGMIGNFAKVEFDSQGRVLDITVQG